MVRSLAWIRIEPFLSQPLLRDLITTPAIATPNSRRSVAASPASTPHRNNSVVSSSTTTPPTIRSVLLHGASGSGKTLLLELIARTLVDLESDKRFVVRTIRNVGDMEKKPAGAYFKVPTLLLIDNLQVGFRQQRTQ